MEAEKEVDYIQKIYNLARVRGYCTRQKEFAQVLEVNETTLSQAMNGKGKYLTRNLMNRVKAWALQVGLVDANDEPIGQGGGGQQGGVYIPAETAEMYTSMAKSIERLSAIVDRLTEK